MIYYYWDVDEQIWLFTVYDKDEADDLTPKQKDQLAQLLKNEVKARARS